VLLLLTVSKVSWLFTVLKNLNHLIIDQLPCKSTDQANAEFNMPSNTAGHRLRVLENRMLRRKFISKREEVMKG
jgi:hypothetical protein